MTTSDEQAEAWVHAIAGRYDRREDAERDLAARGVCEADANYILDMIDMAHSRAITHAIGVPLANMFSNVDDDPIFKAALRHFLRETCATNQRSRPSGPAVPSFLQPEPKPWWKFW